MSAVNPAPEITYIKQVAEQLDSVEIYMPALADYKIRVRQADKTTTFDALFDELPLSFRSYLVYGIEESQNGLIDVVFIIPPTKVRTDAPISQLPFTELQTQITTAIEDIGEYLNSSPASTEDQIQYNAVDDTTLAVKYDQSVNIVSLTLLNQTRLLHDCTRISVDPATQTITFLIEELLPTNTTNKASHNIITHGWRVTCSECGEQAVHLSRKLYRESDGSGPYISLNCRSCSATSITSAPDMESLFDEYTTHQEMVANLATDIKQDELQYTSFGPQTRTKKAVQQAQSHTLTHDGDVYSLILPESDSPPQINHHRGQFTYSIKWTQEDTALIDIELNPTNQTYCSVCSRLLTEDYVNGYTRLSPSLSVEFNDHTYTSHTMQNCVCQDCFETFETVYNLLAEKYSEQLLAHTI